MPAVSGGLVDTADLINRRDCARLFGYEPQSTSARDRALKAYEQMLWRLPELRPRINPATGEISWHPPQRPAPVNPRHFNKLWLRPAIKQWRDELNEWKSWPEARNVRWSADEQRWVLKD